MYNIKLKAKWTVKEKTEWERNLIQIYPKNEQEKLKNSRLILAIKVPRNASRLKNGARLFVKLLEQ